RDVASVKRMASAQQQILKYGANRVKIGGRLIYSTCSVEPEENQSVVDSFIEEYKQFKEVSVEPLMGKKFVDKNGRLSLYGFEMDSDGVFAAKLERFK
nr:SAM-dependent methyltransferase [bacterium]